MFCLSCFSAKTRTELKLAVQWLRLYLPMQGVRVRSLDGELRCHVPHSQKSQDIKQKEYCKKFNKDF